MCDSTHQVRTSRQLQKRSAVVQTLPSEWKSLYGVKHSWKRVGVFPAGVAGPKKVRIYERSNHYILQWWDKAAGKNLTERVDGDLVTAITRAREIDERLLAFRTSGAVKGRLAHEALVEAYVKDLQKRVNAGEISSKTKVRYESALAHYVNFAGKPAITHEYKLATHVDREFALQFAQYLASLDVSPNGHENAVKRPLTATQFVTDTVRGMFRWAADPDRGNLIPEGFRNPFSANKNRQDRHVLDLFGEPDITTPMAIEFVRACDLYQLRLFAVLLVFGLRAAEPVMVFTEDLVGGWLQIRCRAELDYSTKGLRDKRLPIEPWLADLLATNTCGYSSCMLFAARREPACGIKLQSVTEFVDEYRKRRRSTQNSDSVRVRRRLIREAGGTDYDKIEHEFKKISRQLGWPKEATLKDFRHLFSTSLENAGLPTFYRRYLMGQSPGRSALVTYTHIDQLRTQYAKASESTLKPIIDAIIERHHDLLESSRVGCA